jgi:D-glycero-D-manno-heptose 1,7-bisphosphate phosphatase
MHAIFLDRDGVISENRADHVKSWDEFRFIPGALAALRWLRQAGFRTFVVTNQAIVNRGIVSAVVIDDIHTRMRWQIRQHGGQIDDLHFCPHDTGEGCACRKPRPGMLMQLAAKWNVDLARSYMVGDAWTDMAAGRAASCRCVMVRTGRGAEQIEHQEDGLALADHIAADLASAVEWILAQEDFKSFSAENVTSLRPLTSIPWGAGTITTS